MKSKSLGKGGLIVNAPSAATPKLKKGPPKQNKAGVDPRAKAAMGMMRKNAY